MPTLRIYSWLHPATSFGYFEKYAAVANHHPGRDLIRRWTGGGVVLHGADYTYSLIVPAGIPLLNLPTADSYHLIHQQIAKTLHDSGFSASIVSETAPKISQACFENPVRSDILLDNRKIAGAAQRRTRTGLLHQGSIQHPGLPADFGTKLAQNLSAKVTEKTIGPHEEATAQSLAEIKYATPAWLTKF